MPRNRKHGNPSLALDFAFEVGQLFRREATVFKLAKIVPFNFVLENVHSLDRRLVQIAELEKGFLDGVVVPCDESMLVLGSPSNSTATDDEAVVVTGAISMMSDAAQRAGKLRIKYIKALRALGYSSLRPTDLLALEFERLKKQLGDVDVPTLSTLYACSLKVDAQNGDWRAAFPNFAGRGGRGKWRGNAEVLALLPDLMKGLRDDEKRRIRYSAITDDLQKKLMDKHGADKALVLLPSVSSIARYTKKEFGAYFICCRNRGRKVADKKFRDWHPRDRATAPLEVVEFDDKDTRVFGIDERTGLPAGRIYLTSGLDQGTGTPLGFSISDKPRNTWSAINAVVDCVLPKDLSHPDWSEVKSDVPYCGKMAVAVFDNALYNHATHMQAATLDISNAIVGFAQPFTPTEKATAEGFNGLVGSEFLPDLPGFAGAKDSRDLLKEGLLAANLGEAQFRRLLLKWVYDVLCNSPFGDDGATRRQRWEAGMRGRHPRFPSDINRVLLAAMLSRRLKLRPELILFMGLIYQSARLQALRRRLGHNAYVDFKHHPKRIDRIHVQDPFNKEWFVVPSVNPEYTSLLTLAQHRLIGKMARENGIRNPAVPELLHYKAELAKLVEQARLVPQVERTEVGKTRVRR